MPKAPRENHRNTTAGPTCLAGFSRWHLSIKAQSLNDGKLKQRFLRPYFTGQIFKTVSRCQEPTSAHLFGTLRRYELWDPSQPTRGLSPLPDVHFEKLAAPRFLGKDFKGE